MRRKALALECVPCKTDTCYALLSQVESPVSTTAASYTNFVLRNFPSNEPIILSLQLPLSTACSPISLCTYQPLTMAMNNRSYTRHATVACLHSIPVEYCILCLQPCGKFMLTILRNFLAHYCRHILAELWINIASFTLSFSFNIDMALDAGK